MRNVAQQLAYVKTGTSFLLELAIEPSPQRGERVFDLMYHVARKSVLHIYLMVIFAAYFT